MSSVYVPGGVDAVVVMVNTDDLALESVIAIEAGLNKAPESLDCPLTLRATLPVKPPLGVTVTV
jgi:hypothetical protein